MLRLKKGNAVATILIIAVLLVSSYVLVQRSVFPSQSTMLERTQSTFDELVYSGPDDMLEAYAMNGYQYGLNSRWYCEDRNSAPDLDKTKDDFSMFVEDELQSRIATLSEQYPNFNLKVSKPAFALIGDPELPNQINERTTVEITNFSLTIEEGDRTVTKSYDGTQDYDTRFWMIYKLMREWIGCSNGNIYDAIEGVFERRECAFFKDMCFCACDDCWTFCDEVGPGEECNRCPCGKKGAGLPVYTDENCGPDVNFDETQEFTKAERDEIINQYGVTDEDLFEFAKEISKNANQYFKGEGTCNEFTSDIDYDTGIRCTAQVSNPRLSNGFRSAYATHPTGCVEQVDGSCGWVPISQYLSLSCAGGNMCPSPSVLGTTPAEVALRRQLLADIEAGVMTGECINVTVIDIDGNEYTIVQCDNIVVGGEICFDVDGEIVCTETNEIDDCSLYTTLLKSNQGGIGTDPENTLNLDCNPSPPLSDPGPGDGVGDIVGGSSKFKCIDPDSEYIQKGMDSRWYWFGMNGWIDRKGAVDLEITCKDTGTATTDPITAKVKLSIEFMHGCDSSQAAMRGWTPSICRQPGVGSGSGCTLTCDAGPCYRSECAIDPDTEEQYCTEPVPRTEGVQCEGANECIKYKCLDDGAGGLSCQDSGVVNEGRVCGTNQYDRSCNACNSAAECVPANDGGSCRFTSAPCEKYACLAGSCEIQDKPDNTACMILGCADSCLCTGGVPTYSPGSCSDGSPYWISCTEQHTPEQTCEGSPQGGYFCEPVSGTPPQFDTSPCCGLGPGSDGICDSGEICCEGLNVCRTDCGE